MEIFIQISYIVMMGDEFLQRRQKRLKIKNEVRDCEMGRFSRFSVVKYNIYKSQKLASSSKIKQLPSTKQTFEVSSKDVM